MKTGLPCDAVEHDPEVELAFDGEGFFHQQALHQLALGAGLVRDQGHAEDFARQFQGFPGIAGDLDSAAFAAAAGVDLRLDHHAAAQPLGRGLRLLDGECHFAARHRDVVLGQDILGLILVDFHGFLLVFKMAETPNPQYIMSLLPFIGRIVEYQDLNAEEAEAAMRGHTGRPRQPSQIAAFLTAMRMKGPVVAEMVGLARAMRRDGREG